MSADYSVENTVRHASYIGYEVTVATDAFSTATKEKLEAALNPMRLIADAATVDVLLAGFG